MAEGAPGMGGAGGGGRLALGAHKYLYPEKLIVVRWS